MILWMDEIHFAPLGSHGKPWVVGIYRGIESFQGFSGGAGFRPSTVSPWQAGEPGFAQGAITSVAKSAPLLKVTNFWWFNTENPFVGKQLRS